MSKNQGVLGETWAVTDTVLGKNTKDNVALEFLSFAPCLKYGLANTNYYAKEIAGFPKEKAEIILSIQNKDGTPVAKIYEGKK